MNTFNDDWKWFSYQTDRQALKGLTSSVFCKRCKWLLLHGQICGFFLFNCNFQLHASLSHRHKAKEGKKQQFSMKVKFVDCCRCGFGCHYFIKCCSLPFHLTYVYVVHIIIVTITIKFHFLWCCSKKIVSPLVFLQFIFGRNEFITTQQQKWCIFFLFTKNCNDI